MLSTGTILDHYRILERIGAGGMGEVYVAEDTKIERRVAIKVIRSEPQRHPDSAAWQRASRLFLREMKAITLLEDHPNILPMIEFGEEMLENAPLTYMVMPYRKEGSLNDWLQRLDSHEKLSLDDIDHLIMQAADALQHAHNHHIVHQDVKPSNFLIREHPSRPLRPHLLLADFGVAKLINTMSTTSQQVRGTPAFMSPEQWRGKPVPATDQYALAILAYQLMTDSLPFIGGMQQVMYQHCTVPPTPPSTHSPHISPGIDAVILRALAKEPEGRFPSITDFATALHEAILSREDLQSTLRANDDPSPVVSTLKTAIPSPSSPSLPPAESSLSAPLAYEQNANRQIPTTSLPLVSSPMPVKQPILTRGILRVLVIALAVVLLVGTFLVYVSRSSIPPTLTATPTVAPIALITPGKLTAAVTDSNFTYPPEIYYPNELPDGFDIKLIKAIAHAMKLNINIKQYPVDTLIPPQLITSLKAKQFDVIIDAQTLTDEVNREAITVAYLAPKDVLLALNGNPDHLNFNGLTDLCGHTIGVQDGTSELLDLNNINNEKKCQQGEINIVKLPNVDDAADALIQKQNNVEAIYQGTVTVDYYQHKFPEKFQKVGTALPVPKEGMLIRQDNYDMFVAIQNALNSLKRDGTYTKLLNTPMGDLTGDSIPLQ